MKVLKNALVWSVISVLSTLVPNNVQAQSATAGADGVSILDCSAEFRDAVNGCLVRLPSRYKLDRLRAVRVSDEASVNADWQIERDFQPANGSFKATLVLVDLTPGLGSQRLASFNRIEKPAIRRIVDALPEGDRVALYGFSNRVERIVGFTTNKSRVLEAIDGLSLTGANTLIEQSLDEAIRVMSSEDNTILKSIVMVTDGEDEGTVDVAAIRENALAARISVSAMGSFWRSRGAPQNASGEQLLTQITQATLGDFQAVTLNGTEATDEIQAFVDKLSQTRENSLVVRLKPNVTPTDTDITIDVQTPLVGTTDEFESASFTARFDVEGDPEVPADDGQSSDADVDTLAQWSDYILKNWYLLVAALLAILALLVFLIWRRSKRAGEDEQAEGGEVKPGSLGSSGSEDGGEDTSGDRAATIVGSQTSPNTPLLRLRDEKTGQIQEISSRQISIGRSNSNLVVVPDASVSRLHAKLELRSNGELVISDLNSLNRTYFEDRQVTRQVSLGHIDKLSQSPVRLRFGDVKFTLESGSE